jgi:hypothetical protein
MTEIIIIKIIVDIIYFVLGLVGVAVAFYITTKGGC